MDDQDADRTGDRSPDGSLVERLSAMYGSFLTSLAVIAALMLLAMVLLICADVLLRNVPVLPGLHGIYWSNDLTEAMLYLMTALSAPWLLRQGQHIRVDIILRAIPAKIAWYVEWFVDGSVLVCCLLMALYGFYGMAESVAAKSLAIKSVITPEWWFMVPMPVSFVLLSVEALFRMHRLYNSARVPRTDAVSAA